MVVVGGHKYTHWYLRDGSFPVKCAIISSSVKLQAGRSGIWESGSATWGEKLTGKKEETAWFQQSHNPARIDICRVLTIFTGSRLCVRFGTIVGRIKCHCVKCAFVEPTCVKENAY